MNKLKLLWKDNNIQKIILIFIITRLLLLGVGYYAHYVMPSPNRLYDLNNKMENYGTVGPIFKGWDSDQYLEIAKVGYQKINITDLGHTANSLTFYPFYPLVIKFVGLFMGNVAGAIFISNLCLIMSGILLYLLIKKKLGEDLAYKSAKYLLIFPTNFILSAIQTESLFLFLLLLTFFFLERKKIICAGLVGFFLALTRPIGFLAFIPIACFGYKTLKQNNVASFKRKAKIMLSIILPILGLLTFMFYLRYLTGSLAAVVVSERNYGKTFSLDILQLGRLFISNFHSFHFITDIIFGIVMLAFMFTGLFQLGVMYTLITIFILGVYFATTTMDWHILSIPRFFSILFPTYVGVGKMSSDSKIFDFAATLIFPILQMVFFFFWTRGFPIPM